MDLKQAKQELEKEFDSEWVEEHPEAVISYNNTILLQQIKDELRNIHKSIIDNNREHSEDLSKQIKEVGNTISNMNN